MVRKAAFLLVALLGCSVVWGQNRDLSTGQQALAGSDWRLVSMGRVGAETSLVSGTTLTLKFGNDGRVSGSGGCNTFGGTYQVQGDTVRFSQLFSTRRACVDSNANRQESEYLRALEVASRFRITSQRLSIYYDRGRSVLEFADVNASSGSNDGPLNDVDDPVSALIAYYRAIDAKDYRRAYRYWESPTQSLDQFIRGFSDTGSVQVLVDPSPQVEGAAGSSYANISTVVITKRTNSAERMFAGCYVMRKSNYSPDEGVTRQGWRIYRADVQSVASNARTFSLLSGLCRQ